MIIAIDGPSGAGKSTLSRQLAERLRYAYIDTGAMYRCVALAAHREGISPEDTTDLQALCDRIRIRFEPCEEGQRVYLNAEDVSRAIRTPENSMRTSRISAEPVVREAMVQQQRDMGKEGGVVLDGRDIGSVVFPHAEVKLFLTASAEERGRRRYDELRAKGQNVDLQTTIAEVESRDAADSSRSHSPLIQPEGAEVIDSTGMSIEEVLQSMLEAVGKAEAVQ